MPWIRYLSHCCLSPIPGEAPNTSTRYSTHDPISIHLLHNIEKKNN
jgi:hypothetical protein